jgi:cellulose synthase (UDP-forming)
MIEFGGGNIVEDFYRIIMPCRDEFKAAMCVGTSAVYRRKTIQFLNSTPKVHASEDLATGLIITQFGYYVKYLPLIISMGTSPQSYQGYFKQHMRWCSGNLIFAKYWPVAQLSVMARLIYATNPLYYISEALTIVFSFQFLVLLYFHADSLSIVNTLYFLPYIVLSRIAIPLTKANKSKTGTKLAALSNSYTYFYTYIRMATKGLPTWHPTGVKINGLHEDFLEAFNVGTLISSLFITCFLFVLFSRLEVFGNFNTYIVLAWTFYSVFW